jgi:hypothetical protein
MAEKFATKDDYNAYSSWVEAMNAEASIPEVIADAKQAWDEASQDAFDGSLELALNEAKHANAENKKAQELLSKADPKQENTKELRRQARLWSLRFAAASEWAEKTAVANAADVAYDAALKRDKELTSKVDRSGELETRNLLRKKAYEAQVATYDLIKMWSESDFVLSAEKSGRKIEVGEAESRFQECDEAVRTAEKNLWKLKQKRAHTSIEIGVAARKEKKEEEPTTMEEFKKQLIGHRDSYKDATRVDNEWTDDTDTFEDFKKALLW